LNNIQEDGMTKHKETRRTFLAGSAALATGLPYSQLLAQDNDPVSLSVEQAGRLIRSGELTVTDLVEAYLTRIDRLEPRINAFITITGERARQQARELDRELSNGQWRGPLHGIPIGLKDNMDTAGVLTTAASELFSARVPDSDAEVVRRLADAGTVMLGKLNLHEFAIGGTSAVTHYGPVHNPWKLDYIPGGSSGGSGAAVAAGMCAAALGTDTAASVRMPASFCGIVGFKPTYGLSSIRGIIPLSESLDHVGPMCKTVADCALMLQAMAGYDPGDVTSIRTELPDYRAALRLPTSALRLGVPRELFFEDLDAEVSRAVDAAIDVLGSMTSLTTDVELPPTPPFLPILAEAYGYHAEYVEDEANHALYKPVTLARILGGANTPRVEYQHAIRELTLARKAIDAVFEDVDLLITPTSPVLPHTIDTAEEHADETIPEKSARNTLPFNFYGIPTITVPCGFSASGLPIGLQISGPRLGEARVLSMAHAYEQTTDWHTRRPELA
jgi:aspartyl-tRNA(Asn)/glutamyl-tRNA(Gln) amidotransferase subunit A